MFHEFSVWLSLMTGLEPAVLQTTIDGVSVVSNVYAAYRTIRMGWRWLTTTKAAPVLSALACRILEQLARSEWILDGKRITNGTITVSPHSSVRVKDNDATVDFQRHELRMIYYDAAVIRTQLQDDAESSRKTRVAAALIPTLPPKPHQRQGG